MALEAAATDPGALIDPTAINPGGPMIPFLPPPVPEPGMPGYGGPPPPASPAPTPPAAAAPDPAAVGVGPIAGPPNPVTPGPFTEGAFAVQAPGAMVGPIGGGTMPTPFASSLPPGFATVVFPAGDRGERFSATEHEQLAGLPFMPHSTFRAGLGGMARVLHGVGLAGHSMLPRELERHARRTPLTP